MTCYHSQSIVSVEKTSMYTRPATTRYEFWFVTKGHAVRYTLGWLSCDAQNRSDQFNSIGIRAKLLPIWFISQAVFACPEHNDTRYQTWRPGSCCWANWQLTRPCDNCNRHWHVHFRTQSYMNFDNGWRAHKLKQQKYVDFSNIFRRVCSFSPNILI